MKAQVKTHKLRNTFFLFLTAMIWGAAFVAQSVSMDYIGPFTFICLRSVIGGLFLIPVIIVLDGIRKKSQNESADVVSSENTLPVSYTHLNGTIPAVYSERIRLAKHAGMKVMELLKNNVRPSDIMTKKAFLNCLTVDMRCV